ncbi:trichothecene efflux pump [Microdochium trichocladiopsis]|uniref:Trichothecene efflux pump n=1 Tax=Microdochium trichocladiopsis TaxID=1682393 RepID=A0A9P8YDD5_9PEZI|nr:trichothecene efflux pump [Microdochium trichocladiopsis]KAH7037400.1 trichothecene efflux pump [Microdochium trichocladiopsis]
MSTPGNSSPKTGSSEKAAAAQEVEHAHGVRVEHADGTVDYIDEKAIGGDSNAMPDGYFRSAPFILTVVSICMGNICAYTGWVLPANTLLLINASLGGSPNISWVATAWTLGSSIGFLLVGRLSDIFGRRYIVLGGNLMGLVGCIIGATAQTVETLIAASVFNGLAAAQQLSFGIFLGELVPNRLRGPMIAFVFFSAAPFAVFGPSIARAFITNTAAGWRWSFYMSIIFAVVGLTLAFFFYHPPTYAQLHVGGKSKRQQVKELDYIGIVLFVGGCVLFLIGLSWGGVAYPWVSGHVLGTLLSGIVALIIFAVYETYFCKASPLMPPRLFKNVGFVAICVVASIAAMVYYALTILWPVIIMTLYTTDSTQVGLQSAVVGGGILLGQLLGGIGISYIPKVKWQAIISAVIGFVFVTSLISVDPSRWAATIGLALIALIAIGYNDDITFPGVTLVVEPQDIGLATGVMGSIRGLAGAVAQALYVSVQSNKLEQYMADYVTSAATSNGLPQSSLTTLFKAIAAGDFSAVPGMTPSIAAAVGQAVQLAYRDSFKMVFYATIPFSIIMIIGSAFIPNMEKKLHMNVAKKLQNASDDSAATRNKAVTQDV